MDHTASSPALRCPVYDSIDDLDCAMALCERINRTHSKSFHFSSAFLSAGKRRAIRAFYAFCRVTDDMIDSPTPCSVEEFSAWRLASRRSADSQTHPVLMAWTHVREKYGVPQQYIEELIDGCEMDRTISRYDTWESLTRYCYCVASTVGLVSMHIIGLTPGADACAAKDLAIDLGIALQLTNILRDVGEDLGRGRIYLPREDLARFDLGETDLESGAVDARFRTLMQFEIARAKALYERGLPGIAHLNPDGRLAVGAAGMLYRQILGAIEHNEYDVFTRRAHLTASGKVRRLPEIFQYVSRLELP
jgi:15-cis-phytoene synthase